MAGHILVLDTATRTPVVGLADGHGQLVDERHWSSRHRHGEELLERIDDLLAAQSSERRGVGGVIVGTGPGSFTGLRIGLATAKVLAYSLDVPLVGISTTVALALAAAREARAGIAVTLPAGAADRYLHLVSVSGGAAREMSPPQLVAAGDRIRSLVDEATLVAVDIDASDIDVESVERGRAAVLELAAALARLGTEALAAGQRDDPALLVPAYVALPRGIAQAAAEMKWSPDLR